MISHIFSPFLYHEKWTSKRPPLTSWTRIGNSLPNPTKGYGLVARSGYHTQTRVQTFSPLPVSWADFYCSTKGAYSTKSRRNRSIHKFTHLKLKNMLDDFPTKPLSRIVSQGALWLFFLFAKRNNNVTWKGRKLWCKLLIVGEYSASKSRWHSWLLAFNSCDTNLEMRVRIVPL